MKFTEILKSVINESSKFKVNFDKYVSKDDEDTSKPLTYSEYVEIVKADPTTRLNGVEITSDIPEKEHFEKIKAGSYVPWIIKSYLNVKGESLPGERNYERDIKRAKDRFMEDLFKVRENLIKYDRFKHRFPKEYRDINKLTPRELYGLVKDFDLTLASTTKKERASSDVHPGGKLVFDGAKWRVIKIEDKGELGREAACFYGGNKQETDWCTAAPGLNYFDDYIKKGPLYVIYKRDDEDLSPSGLPKIRYQFHFQDEQFMDKDDEQIDLVSMLNGEMKELKDLFKKDFQSVISKFDKNVRIESFYRGIEGKFISLYGFEEFINLLPSEITELYINNTDSKLKFDIPESISRFQNLTFLFLGNCVVSLPDTLCDLKNLEYCALPNNNSLKSLPECLGDETKMTNLNMVNLSGTDVKIPSNFVKYGLRAQNRDVWFF